MKKSDKYWYLKSSQNQMVETMAKYYHIIKILKIILHDMLTSSAIVKLEDEKLWIKKKRLELKQGGSCYKKSPDPGAGLPREGGGYLIFFLISSVFFAWRAWRGWSTIENLTLILLVSKISFLLKHYGDLWSTGKSFV